MFSRLHRRRSNLQDLGRLSKSCPAVDSPGQSDSDSDVDSSFECASTASIDGKEDAESSEDASPPVSPLEQRLARQSVRRARQREVQQQRNMEENKISMDDYLGKQGQFCTWLLEQQKKQYAGLSSPQRKTYFKMFVRLWNKRQLPPKYYEKRTSKHMDDSHVQENVEETPSPAPSRPPLFRLMQDSPLLDPSIFPHCVDLSSDSIAATPSPFSTFGKSTPSAVLTQTFSLDRGASLRKTPVRRKRSMSVSDKENTAQFSFPVTAAAAEPMRTASISPHKKMASVCGRPAVPLTLYRTRSSKSDLKVTPVESPRCPGDFTQKKFEQNTALSASPHIYSEADDLFSPQYAELQFADDSAIIRTPQRDAIKSPLKSPGGRLNRRRSRSMDDIPTYAVPVKSNREQGQLGADTVSEEDEEMSASPPPLPPKLFKLHEEGLGLQATVAERQTDAQSSENLHGPSSSQSAANHFNRQTEGVVPELPEQTMKQLVDCSNVETSSDAASKKPSKKLFKGRLPWLKKLTARRRSRSCEDLSPRISRPEKGMAPEEKEAPSNDFPLLKLDGSPTLSRRAIVHPSRPQATSVTESKNDDTKIKPPVPQSSSAPTAKTRGNDTPQFLPASVSKLRQSIRRRSRSLEQIPLPSSVSQSPWRRDPDVSYYRWPSPCDDHRQQQAARKGSHQHPSTLASGHVASSHPSSQKSDAALGEYCDLMKPQCGTDEREETPMEVDELDSSPKRPGQGIAHRQEMRNVTGDRHIPSRQESLLGRQEPAQTAVFPHPTPQLMTFSGQHGPSRVQAENSQNNSSSAPSVPFPQVPASSASSLPPAPPATQISHQIHDTSKVYPTSRSACQKVSGSFIGSKASCPGSATSRLFPAKNVPNSSREQPPKARPLHDMVSKLGTSFPIEQLSSLPRRLGTPRANESGKPLFLSSNARQHSEKEGFPNRSEAFPEQQASSSHSLSQPGAVDSPGNSDPPVLRNSESHTLHTAAASMSRDSASTKQLPPVHVTASPACSSVPAPRPLPAVPAKAKPCATPTVTSHTASEILPATAVPERLRPDRSSRPQRRRSRSVDGASFTSTASILLSKPLHPSSPGFTVVVPEKVCGNIMRESAFAGEVVHSVSQVQPTLWQPHHNTWVNAKNVMPGKQESQEQSQIMPADNLLKSVTDTDAGSRCLASASQVPKSTPGQYTGQDSEFSTNSAVSNSSTRSGAPQLVTTQACNTLARQLSVKISRQNSRRRSRSVGDVSVLQDDSTAHQEDGASFGSLKAFWDRQRGGSGPKVQRNFSINRKPREQPDQPSPALVASQVPPVSRLADSPRCQQNLTDQQHDTKNSHVELNSSGLSQHSKRVEQQEPFSPGGELPIQLSPFITVRRNSSLRSRNGRGGSPSCPNQEPKLNALTEGSTEAQTSLSGSSVHDTGIVAHTSDAGKKQEGNEGGLKEPVTFSAVVEEKQPEPSVSKSPVVTTLKTACNEAKPKQRPVPPPKPSKRNISAAQLSLMHGSPERGISQATSQSTPLTTGKESAVSNQKDKKDGPGEPNTQGSDDKEPAQVDVDCTSTEREEKKQSAPIKRRSSSRRDTPSSTPAKRRSSGRLATSTPQSGRRGSGVSRVVSGSAKRRSSGRFNTVTHNTPKRQGSNRTVDATANSEKPACEDSPQAVAVTRQLSVRQIAKAFSSPRRSSSGRRGTNLTPVTRQNSGRGATASSVPVSRQGSDRQVRGQAASLARQSSVRQGSSPAPEKKQITQRQDVPKATVTRQSSGRRAATNSPLAARQNKEREDSPRVAQIRKQIAACEEAKLASPVRRFNSAREESKRSPYVTRNYSARESSRRSQCGKRRSGEGSGPIEAQRSHSRAGKVRRTSSSRSSKGSVDSRASNSDGTSSRGGSFRKKTKPPQSPTFMRITRNLHAEDDRDNSSDEDTPVSTSFRGESRPGESMQTKKGKETAETNSQQTRTGQHRNRSGPSVGNSSHGQRMNTVSAESHADLETDIDTFVEEPDLGLEAEVLNQQQTHAAETMV